MNKIQCAHSSIVRISEIKENPKNENVHTEKQIEVLARIIDQTGQRSPIIVSNLSGMIVRGHGRKMAMEKLGWESCAVDYQDYDTEIEEMQDRIADNEIARHAKLDMDAFDLSLKDFDLNFNEIDLEAFGLIAELVDFDDSQDDEKDKEEKAAQNQIIVKCQDEAELEELVFEFQTKGLNFEVKA